MMDPCTASICCVSAPFIIAFVLLTGAWRGGARYEVYEE